MINLYNLVPSVYVNASRDFQYLVWLFNIVLNSVKHNVDDLYDLPNNKTDPKLTELLALTLGFKVKRNYDQKQLLALISIFPSILKYKGTYKAIKMAGEALIAASGSSGSFEYRKQDNTLIVLLPKELVDTTLFIDLLPYILPAGMSCHIVRKTQTKVNITTEVKHKDEIIYESIKDLGWGESLSGLYASGENNSPEFSNFKKVSEAGNDPTLNAGLMDNTLIPDLGTTLAMERSEEVASDDTNDTGSGEEKES